MLKSSIEGERFTFLSPRNLEIKKFTISPAEIGEKEILLKTKWTLISPGTEVAIYSGEDKNTYRKGGWCNYPFNPGYANIAEVIEFGKSVNTIKKGNYVYFYVIRTQIK